MGSLAVSIASNEENEEMNMTSETTLSLHARLRASVRRRHAAGVTLFEVLIVVAILAMIAGGVAFFALPQYQKAQITTAKSHARIIRQAVSQWQATNNETTCPTMSQLVQEKLLDPGQTTNDPWQQPFSLSCSEDGVTVGSPGPDKKKGTKDDIVIPESAAAPAGGEAAP
jgi:prepilin-type N-terminal cleavage/methylation domain-containing protein